MSCPICHQALPPGSSDCPQCAAQALGRDTTLKLRYRLAGLIGRGGFGLTYQAIDLTTGELVALKELYPDGASRVGRDVVPTHTLRLDQFQTLRGRFLEVMRSLALLPHPNLLPILDVFEQHGTAYAATPLLRGLTLAERLSRTGPLLSPEVRRVATGLAGALRALHAAGYLHRDLKPSNVFLCDDGRVLLIDMDTVHSKDTAGFALPRLVSSGYTPIEQYAGNAQFSPAVDIYALGATLYHALLGQMPPSATDLITGTASLDPHPPSAEPALSNAISRAMAMRALDRPQDIQAFLELLDDATPERSPQEARKPLTFRAHSSAVTALVHDHRGLLMSTSADHTAKLWSLTELHSAAVPVATFQDHSDAVRSAAFAGAAGWVTGGDDGQAVLRHTRGGHARRLRHAEAVVALSATDHLLACATRARQVQIWSLEHEELLATSQRLPHWPTALHHVPGGALFAGLQDGRLLLLHGESARLQAERQAHEGRVTSLASCAGKVYSTGIDAHLRCWSPLGELIADVVVGHLPLQGVVAQPDSGLVYAVNAAGTVYRIDAVTFEPEQIHALSGEPSALTLTSTALIIGLTDGRVTSVPLT